MDRLLLWCHGFGSFLAPMANNNAKMIHFPWKIGTGSNKDSLNQSGYFTMKKGTYDYLFPLGVPEGGPGDLTEVYTQKPKEYQRQLYAGGPTVTVKRTEKQVTRTRSYKASSARSERKLHLSESDLLGDSGDTIYYTGHTYAAVTWLKSYASVAVGGVINITGAHGQKYDTITPAVVVPPITAVN